MNLLLLYIVTFDAILYIFWKICLKLKTEKKTELPIADYIYKKYMYIILR